MLITIHDKDDGCDYQLDISMEDALEIYNMETLNKDHVELPSIEGNASISNGNVDVIYKNGASGHGSITASLETLQKVIDAAM